VTQRRDELLLNHARLPGSMDHADVSPRWTDLPTQKARAGVQRAVARLLDALAPERAVVRTARPRQPVERHRTPQGCVLQGPAAAVSVSWFPDAASDAAYGELQVLAWRGVVSRPGSAHREAAGATIARALVLRPDEREAPAAARASDGETDDETTGAEAESVGVEWGWRAEDGTCYETDALAAHCLALLEQQVAGDVTAVRSR
jgi:hypothetical protein